MAVDDCRLAVFWRRNTVKALGGELEVLAVVYFTIMSGIVATVQFPLDGVASRSTSVCQTDARKHQRIGFGQKTFVVS